MLVACLTFKTLQSYLQLTMVYGIIRGHYLPGQIDRHVSDIEGRGLKKGDAPKGRLINKPGSLSLTAHYWV